MPGWYHAWLIKTLGMDSLNLGEFRLSDKNGQKKILKKKLNIWKHLACNYPARKLKKRFITVSKCLKRWLSELKWKKRFEKQLRPIFFALKCFFEFFLGSSLFVWAGTQQVLQNVCAYVRYYKIHCPWKSPSGKLGVACMWYIDVQPPTLFDYFLPM